MMKVTQLQLVVDMTTKDKYLAFQNARVAKKSEHSDVEIYEPTQDDYAEYFKGIPDLTKQLQHWIQIVKFYGAIPAVSLSANSAETNFDCLNCLIAV
jgi:hypothetical protein